MPEEWFERFQAASEAGRPEEALEILDQAVADEPESTRAWGIRGTLLGERGRHEEALACFERVVALDPQSAPGHYSRGLELERLGRLDEAIEAYTRTTELDPEDPDAWINLGRLLDDSGRHQPAIDCYDRALALDQGEVVAWSNRGNSLQSLERFEEAVECYQRALRLVPDHPPARLGLASGLAYLGRLEESNAARPLGSPLDRGEVRELRRALGGGRLLVLRWFLGRHTRPDDLTKLAEEVLDRFALMDLTSEGLAEGNQLACGWSRLTIRARGDERVVCEPDFHRDPAQDLVHDATLTLQTLYLAELLHHLVGVPPSPCIFLDTIALAPDAMHDEVWLVRLHETDERGRSGWVVGGAPPEELARCYRLGELREVATAQLVPLRPHLIKALTLPAGFRVRFRAHAVTSVRDPDDEERWIRPE